MDELCVANKRLKEARDEQERDYEEHIIAAQDEMSNKHRERMSQFN
jgi:hypothetical protein